jgi:hypothetical protein
MGRWIKAIGPGVARVEVIARWQGRTSPEENAMVPSVFDNKGTKILAKSLFKELRGNGYSTNQILNLSTELIDLVTQDLKDEHAQASAAAQAAVVAEATVTEVRAAL